MNDPLGQSQSLASSEHCFRLKFVLFWKVGMDGRHVRKQLSLPAVTVGRPSGSIQRIMNEFRVGFSAKFKNGEEEEKKLM